MKWNSCWWLMALQAAALIVSADILELKNGQVLTGRYVGGTASTVTFDPGSGPQTFNTSDAAMLTFRPAIVAAPTAAPTPATPGSSAMTGSIPAGTTLLVRMVDGVSSKDSRGKRYTAALESDLVAGGRIVARAGTKVYGRVEKAQSAGRYVGQSELDIRLTEIAVGGSLVPVMTGPYAQAGSRSAGKTARGAAAGAAIGAIAGDAGKGAAIGAVASGLRRGEAVVIPPGTLLEFQLTQTVTVTL